MRKDPPPSVLEAYAYLGKIKKINLITMGLINTTWLVETTKIFFILQEVSSIFDTTIHDDARAVGGYLKQQKLCVPEILPDINNQLFYNYSGRIFRALKYIAGKSFHKITCSTMAEQAGSIVGQFHSALRNFEYEYCSKRRQGGDFAYHAHNLSEALKRHEDHEYYKQVKPLALAMLNNLNNLNNNPSISRRHIHGDPKISNIIFDDNFQALALIDFDTLNNNGWVLEMSDALRSWCNPNQEDVLEAYADLNIAKSALSAYGEVMKGAWTCDERAELVSKTQSITLCLAMRYLVDVFYESYWTYDQERFLRPADHNLQRARAMYALYEDFASKKILLAALVERYL